jgi:hypothetical protein
MKGHMSSSPSYKGVLQRINLMIDTLDVLPTDRENTEFVELSKLTVEAMKRDLHYVKGFVSQPQLTWSDGVTHTTQKSKTLTGILLADE